MIDAISSATGSVAQTLFALANPRAVASNAIASRVAGLPNAESSDAAVKAVEPATGSVGETELTEEERAEVEKLRQRDQEVRRHEQAHKAAAGQHARGGPSFEYETGPDGRQYATGGHVNVDTSEVSGDPQATIAKMQQVRRAALSPGDPSSEDRQIAAQAAQKEQQARAELARQKTNGEAETTSGTTVTANVSNSASILGTGRPQPTATSGTGSPVHRATGVSSGAGDETGVGHAYAASSVGFIRPGRFINVQA